MQFQHRMSTVHNYSSATTYELFVRVLALRFTQQQKIEKKKNSTVIPIPTEQFKPTCFCCKIRVTLKLKYRHRNNTIAKQAGYQVTKMTQVLTRIVCFSRQF